MTTIDAPSPGGITAQQRGDLDIARGLAGAGIPIFVAHPDPLGKGHNDTGFWLPTAWQQTVPDPAVADLWRPGMALCAVMGCGLDLTDIDPRNGGDAATMNGSTPTYYAIAFTPSGGIHGFHRSTGAGSRDNVFPGIDIKSGLADGSGRGFAFLAPTVRASKVTGEPAAYTWAQAPDLERLANSADDRTGEKLAARIRAMKSGSGVKSVGGPSWWQGFMRNKEPQAQAAAERAITEKLTEVRNWTPGSGGGFRLTMQRAAMTLGGYVGGGYLLEHDARARLLEAAEEVWGTPDEDDELWIAQGLADGAEQPFYVYTAEDELLYESITSVTSAVSGTDQEPPWSVYQAITTYPFDPNGDGSDQGLAEAVAARMAPALRYGVDSATWLVRGPWCWREREDMSSWAVSTVARLMPLGSTPVPKEISDRTEMHWQAVRRAKFMDSGGAGKVERKLRAIVRNTDHPSGVELGELDVDPEVLWAGGMPWNLRASGDEPTLADVDPATPHLRAALCAPQPVPTPHWDTFVAAVFPNPALRAWALRVLSISLAGYPDAALPVLYGSERTGKTQIVSLLVKALGSYGHAADPRLLAGADNAHASVVYALKGRRLSFIDEGPRRGHLAAERLKQLTGGGELTGNAMRANPVTFSPTHTLIMTTNDEPPITDPALRARMRIIPCDADKAAVRAARQALTPAAWRAEVPGVLAAMMAQCAAWLDDPDSAGIDRAPDEVRGSVAEMAAGQDPVREWTENCTVPTHPGTQARVLYRAFQAWHEGQPAFRRAPVPSETAFGRTLSDLGYPAAEGQGPKKNQRYRPLSVMGGMPGGAPWPTSTATSTPEGPPLVADGSGAQPSGSENPSSNPISSISSDSSVSTHQSIDNTTHTSPIRSNAREKYRGIGAVPATPGEKPNLFEPDQENQGSPGDSAEGSETRSPLGQTGDDPKSGPDLDTDFDPLQNVTSTRVAAYAVNHGLTKTEARAELNRLKREAKLAAKAHARQEKIDTFAGERIGLPAVCDRSGNVLRLNLEQAAAVVRTAMARTGGALTVDIENTGYPLGHELYALRTIQLGDEMAAVDFDAADTEQTALVGRLLGEATWLHAHSATADLVPLVHAGLIELESAWDRMHDTVIAAKLGDPQSTGSDPGLKKLSPAVLGAAAVSPVADENRAALFTAAGWLTQTKITTPIEKSGWAQVDPGCETMIRYAASDVLDTAALPRRLPQVPPAIMERERLAQRMTARVTHHGVALDHGHVQTMLATHQPQRDQWGAKVRELGAGHIENPGSDTQIAKAALALGAQLPRTENGNPSVAKDVLEPLKTADGVIGEFVRAVLEFRHHDTVLGTFLEPYRLLCEQGDGRARPTVYTLGTDTGRMSCVRPNLQQLPRQGGVRACVTANPGQLMIGADFSGVELRVAAALSGDPFLRQLLTEGRDLHEEIALQVFGADPVASAEKGRPTPKKEHRYVSKRIVFGRLYGGGVPTLAAQAGVAHHIAQAAVDTLDALTPGLAAWSESIRQAVRAGHTQFPSYSGRVIHLPRAFPHKGPNYCIQGSAREVLVDALVKWRDTRWGACTLLPVHDELDVFVPAEDAEQATAELIRCMETELYGIKIVVDPSKPSFAWKDSS